MNEMNGTGPDEIHKAYHVARLNWEKSERVLGQLAKFLAQHSMAVRLAMIAVEQRMVHAEDQFESDGRSRREPVRMAPIPHEVREELREMREWRAATLSAYERIPPAERQRLPRPIPAASMTREIGARVRLS